MFDFFSSQSRIDRVPPYTRSCERSCVLSCAESPPTFFDKNGIFIDEQAANAIVTCKTCAGQWVYFKNDGQVWVERTAPKKAPEPKPYDLDKMVEEALSRVNASIAQSPHSYKLLGNDSFDREYKAKGFVTIEGSLSYMRMTTGIYSTSTTINSISVSTQGIGVNPISTFTVTGEIVYNFTLEQLSNVDTVSGFVVLKSKLPKWLHRFVRRK